MSRPLLVVVGDTLLDRDVDGRVRRVAPDAPAPIVEEESSIDRPGGAGLAAVFAAGEGFDVALVTAIADDAGGARLGEMFAAAGVEVYPLSKAGATPEKIRVRAGGRVLMRLDRGGSPSDPQGAMPAAVPELLSSASAILVSDYGNGITRHPQVRASLADRHRAPMVWDPQPQGPSPVPGVRLVTPNLCVAREISGDAGGGSVLVVAARCGQVLRRRGRDSVRRVKGPDRPLTGQSDRRRLLEALHCVDAVVVFDEPTPEAVLTWLRPDIWVKGGDYADGGPDLPEAEVVRRCGGQTVLVPYLDGRSTARTIAAARGRAGGA
jgi:rfaE bifunctional protein nucleotidyltransferase chain/domain